MFIGVATRAQRPIGTERQPTKRHTNEGRQRTALAKVRQELLNGAQELPDYSLIARRPPM
jgi:hypothetical protein